MIRKAHELNILKTSYVFDSDQARVMAEAGTDILVARIGLTTKRYNWSTNSAYTGWDCVEKIEVIIAGREVNTDIIVNGVIINIEK